MFSRFLNWINERWPVTPLVRLALNEDMAGGSSFAYVFGSSALILFLLQAATGIWQLFYYVPTIAQGYVSLNYLRTEVPFGWLIHGFHYWGANAMVICVLLHMSQVFIWGAYKRPHELQWVTGVFLFLLTMIMSLTGGALPWDKRSYWLIEVAGSAAGSMPVIGDWIKRIMIGGGVIGQLTLSRFFILHAALLSGALATLAAVHLVALRTVGNAGPWDSMKRARTGPFWPDQVFKDGLVATSILVALVALSVIFPPPYAGMADPLDASYIPKPEWNFLFFYEAVKYFPGKLEIVATAGIPLFGLSVLLLIPFVDRSPERRPLKRPAALALWAVTVAAFTALTVAGALSKPEGLIAETEPPPAAQTHAAALSADVRPAALSASEKAGHDLFLSQGCAACHRIGQTGGSIGPDLSGEGLKGRTREWLQQQLINPKSHNASSIMPPQTALDAAAIGQLIDFLLAQKAASTSPAGAAALPAPAAATTVGPQGSPGTAVTIIGSADHGAILFEKSCSSCHGRAGKGKIANPGSTDGTIPSLNPIAADEYSPDPGTFVMKIDRYLQHGSRPAGPKPQFSMPPFGKTNVLTQQQIADLEAYILSLNGVDRARINHPGIAPDIFLIITAFIFSLIGLNLFGWWRFGGLGKKRKSGGTE